MGRPFPGCQAARRGYSKLGGVSVTLLGQGGSCGSPSARAQESCGRDVPQEDDGHLQPPAVAFSLEESCFQGKELLFSDQRGPLREIANS